MQPLLKDPELWRRGAFVGGEWIDATPHGTYALRNPATDETLVELPRFKEAETANAIDVAHKAFLTWRQTTAKARSEILRRWYELMLRHRDDLATLITLEEGKPLAEAKVEIDYAASFLQWFSEEAKRVRGDVIPAPRETARIVVLKEPIGVCAAITPWNFPAAMITRKAGPALAAGCSMVVKPASQTPLTALALAELARRAGVPAGVFNVVTGNDTRAIGNQLTSHPLVRKITFTGSTEVGRVLLAQAASTIKKCSMELGGNAPFIVFDDADLEAAVEGALQSKYRNTGQTCVCANRFLVQDGVYEEFTARLAQAVSALKVGDGFTPGVAQGPLIDRNALEKVEQHVADATSKGARIVIGGKRHALGGTFYEPTILANATTAMQLAREETFGPVAPLFRFAADDDAIRIANDTEFGLASYFYSRDNRRIWRAAERLEYGMVGVNTGIISTEVAPFGGMKESGIGREGSKYGIEEYVEVKYVALGGL
jgi:succinate-semialdehyde dehydrogenase/glutarate-semialdehyde dehydrogenase